MSEFSVKFPHLNSFVVPFVFLTVGMGVNYYAIFTCLAFASIYCDLLSVVTFNLFSNNFPTSMRSGFFLLVWSRLGII